MSLQIDCSEFRFDGKKVSKKRNEMQNMYIGWYPNNVSIVSSEIFMNGKNVANIDPNSSRSGKCPYLGAMFSEVLPLPGKAK